MNHVTERRQSVRAAMAGLLFLAVVVSCGRAQRPNILFVFTDDHAAHAIGAYGSKINQTPNLDRLAREGMLFRNCFVTNSICAPSRAVIQTGKHSHLNGVFQNGINFDGSQQTFPKLLQKAGYQTAVIGKWHLRSDPVGFDHWSVLVGQGPYYNPVMRTPAGRVPHTGYTTDIITDQVLDWLREKRDKTRPFMMMYQHKAPHREWAPGPAHLTKYDDRKLPEPETLFDDYSGRATPARQQAMTVARDLSNRDLKFVPPRNLTKEQLALWNAAYGPKNAAFKKAGLTGKDLVRWKYQRYVKDYLRCVDSVDDNLGRVLDYLDESGLAANTVVIYSSDQGWYLGDHGWYDKRWMYEESLRMPLLVRWPQVVKPGSTNKDLVQNLDFAQTFLEIAGASQPADMQGRSLVTLLRGRTPEDWRKSIYYHYYEFPGWHDVRRHYGVRTARHKLIHYYNVDEWELFDLERDPSELKSVYSDPRYAGVVSDLKAELVKLRKQCGADAFEEPPAPPDPRKVPFEKIVHFSADKLTIGKAQDLSGKGRHGILRHVKTTKGRKGQAFLLEGNGMIRVPPTAGNLDPTFRPLTVDAWCKPRSADGVLFSHGNRDFGYALYIRDHHPTFAVRRYGHLLAVTAPNRIEADAWVHLAGTINSSGELALWVNGLSRAILKEVAFISRNPRTDFRVGADPTGHLGGKGKPLFFNGLIESPRLHWGAASHTQIRKWASR